MRKFLLISLALLLTACSTTNYEDYADYEYKIHRREFGLAQDLIRQNLTTEEKETLIENSHETLGYLKELASPANSKFTFFTQVIPESDSPDSAYLALNEITLKLTELKMNELLPNPSFAHTRISPDHTRMLLIPSSTENNGIDQALYLVDLINDSYKLLLQLEGDDSFNAGYGGLSSSYDVEWIDDFTLGYSTFDPEKYLIESNEIEL